MGVIESILVTLGSKLLTYAAIGLLSMIGSLLAALAPAVEGMILLLIVVHSLDEENEKKEGNQPPATK